MILIFTIDKDRKDSLILVAGPPKLVPKGLEIISSLNYTYRTNIAFVSNDKNGYSDAYFKGRFVYLGLLGKKGNFCPPHPPKLRLPSVQYYDDIAKKIYEVLQHMYPNKTIEPFNIFDIEKAKNELCSKGYFGREYQEKKHFSQCTLNNFLGAN